MGVDTIFCKKKMCFLADLWATSSLGSHRILHRDCDSRSIVREHLHLLDTLLTSRCPRKYSPEPCFQLRKWLLQYLLSIKNSNSSTSFSFFFFLSKRIEKILVGETCFSEILLPKLFPQSDSANNLRLLV